MKTVKRTVKATSSRIRVIVSFTCLKVERFSVVPSLRPRASASETLLAIIDSELAVIFAWASV